MSELKPCPFCGMEAVFARDIVGWLVVCKSCGARTGWFRDEYNHMAVAVWNRRVNDIKEV